MRLWVKQLPKKIRFHDLRTTFATHLHERTGDIQLVQKLLGHSSPAITAAIDSGIRDDYARAAVNKRQFAIHAENITVIVDNGSANDRYIHSPTSPHIRQLPMITGGKGARAAGVEPATFGSGGAFDDFAEGSQETQDLVSLELSEKLTSLGLAAFHPISPRKVGNGSAGLESHFQIGDLLTVREVAKRLRCCTATVYRLIEKGQLPAMRVAGALIRVREADLQGVVVDL